MANNNEIFNAVLTGATGGFQERWISSEDSAAYNTFIANVLLIATAVDDLIPPDTISSAQKSLMQSIAQGVFAGRYPQGSEFDSIAASIVALYTSAAAQLLAESAPPSGSGDTAFFTVESTNIVQISGPGLDDGLFHRLPLGQNTFNGIIGTGVPSSVVSIEFEPNQCKLTIEGELLACMINMNASILVTGNGVDATTIVGGSVGTENEGDGVGLTTPNANNFPWGAGGCQALAGVVPAVNYYSFSISRRLAISGSFNFAPMFCYGPTTADVKLVNFEFNIVSCPGLN